MSWLVSYFKGRHTLFVVVCLAIGCTMSWYRRLDANLVTLLLGLQAMVLGHSIKEGYLGDR